MPFPNLQTSFAYSEDPKSSASGTVLLGSYSSTRSGATGTRGIVFQDGVRSFGKFLFVYGNLTASANASCIIQISTTSPGTFIESGYTNTDGAGGTSDITGGLLVGRFEQNIPVGYTFVAVNRAITSDYLTTCLTSRLGFANISAFSRLETCGAIIPNANTVAFRFLYDGGATFTGEVSLYGLL